MSPFKKIYITFFILLITLYGTGQPPVISSFSPLTGPVGTTLTIVGSNFDPVATNNIVYIGGVRAHVNASTATTITAVVPAGITSAPISVTTNNLIAYSRLFFVTTFPVANSNFSPASFSTPVLLCSSSAGNRGGFFGDLNDDRKLDMLSSNEYGYVALTRNTSSGGNISFDPNILVPISNGSYGTSMADYDGDGKLDISMAKVSSSSADFFYGQLSVMRNITTSSTITFDTRIDLYAYEGEKSWYWITSADIDNDGKVDIILSNNSGGGQIAIFRNTSTPGNISFALPIKYTTPGSPREVTTGDVDGDGKRDIIIATQSGVISFFRNLSTTGSFSLAARQDFTTPYGGFEPLSTDPGSSEVVVFADVDNDGKPDILVSHHNFRGSWSVFRNTSNTGSISLATRIDFTTGPFCYGLATGDLNGDGKLDVAACTREYRAGFSSFLYVFNNQSTPGNISFANQVTNTGYNYSSEVLIADLNNDSKPELIVKMQGNGQYVYFKNNIAAPASPAQVGVGTTTPSSYAALDLVSSNQGLLLPKLSETEVSNLPGPANGLIVFNTTTQKMQIHKSGVWHTVTSTDIIAANTTPSPAKPTVTIAGSAAVPSAVLSVFSKGNKGLLIPRQTVGMGFMVGTEGVIYFELSSPSNGLMLYNGTSWVAVGTTPAMLSAGGVSSGFEVGIGTTAPHPSASLDISSSSKGLKLPLLFNTERDNLESPEEGLLIYNRSTNRMNVCVTVAGVRRWEKIQ